MELTGSSAGGSGSVLVGLGTRSGVKSKHLASAYSHGASYKKPKKPVAVGSIINMSAGSLSLEDLGEAGAKSAVSWGSNVGSVASSVSGLSDAENMMNLVTKEMSYADLVKTITWTKLRQGKHTPEPSTPSKFPGIIRSSFTSEISLNKAREMAIGKKILVNDNLRKMDVHSDQEVIVKEIPVDLPRLAVESVFSKFGKIVSIKIQLVGFWQKALVEFESSEIASLVVSK
ncbi:hypothetical protein G9A89_017958 [Geosiphon pyriformis]|nr:hypothetical protein G9A89_017958 [Geosiphon pyriformis]